MTKHTPGPWEITDSNSDSFRIGSEDFGGIAFIHDPLAPEMGRMAEVEANANLIAAAPELLEALEKITSMGSNTDAWPVETEMRKIARAAIAKAKQ